MGYFETEESMRKLMAQLRPKLLRTLPTIEMAQEFPGLSSNDRVSRMPTFDQFVYSRTFLQG